MSASKRVTLKDIANELNMCFTSVSRILRGDTRFNDETIRMVQEKAREMNYRPNIMARALTTKGTSFVGLIVKSVSGSFNPMLINGVQDALEIEGYSILLGTSHHIAEAEKRHLHVMIDKFVDGVIITPTSCDNENLAIYNELIAQNIPLVIIGLPKQGVNAPIVYADDVVGGRLVAKHFVHIGHEVFAYISPSIKEVCSNKMNTHAQMRFYTSENKARYEGFVRGLHEFMGGKPACKLLDAHGNEGVSEPVVRELLALKPLPTAVFCYSDLYALQLIRLLQAHGVRVPQDISVVGYDDMELAALTGPALTTIQQPKLELGRVAAQKLVEMINGTRSVDCIMKPQLIVRESTCPPSKKARGKAE